MLRVFRPEDFRKPEPVSWEEAIQKLETAMTANNNRPITFRNYLCILRVLRAILPDTTGPLDIGPDKAQCFKDEYLGHGYTPTKAENAAVYKRSPTSFNSYLQQLRSMWHKWFKQLKLVKDNPWETISYAMVDKKKPESPEESLVAEFFQWVKGGYPGWDLPILFLQMKCLLGCRLMDLCSVRSDQLKNGWIDMDPDRLKARDFRRVPLPASLYRTLDDLKGPTYLWEGYNQQLREHLTALGSGPVGLAASSRPRASTPSSVGCSGTSRRQRARSSSRTCYGSGRRRCCTWRAFRRTRRRRCWAWTRRRCGTTTSIWRGSTWARTSRRWLTS